jgi:hypothetical protein
MLSENIDHQIMLRIRSTHDLSLAAAAIHVPGIPRVVQYPSDAGKMPPGSSYTFAKGLSGFCTVLASSRRYVLATGFHTLRAIKYVS